MNKPIGMMAAGLANDPLALGLIVGGIIFIAISCILYIFFFRKMIAGAVAGRKKKKEERQKKLSQSNELVSGIFEDRHKEEEMKLKESFRKPEVDVDGMIGVRNNKHLTAEQEKKRKKKEKEEEKKPEPFNVMEQFNSNIKQHLTPTKEEEDKT